MFVVLLGPPGVGKGTQAEMLEKELGLPHISSGDLFREAIKNKTALGKKAQRYIDQGKLVPDKITIAMVVERLNQPDCAKGAILDGFPRTIGQAKALDKALAQRNAALTLVFYINGSIDTLMQRVSGRRTCRNCQAVYHILFNPPKEPGKCDLCGGELYQREDDSDETQSKRIEVYLEQTAPLVEHYRKRGLLMEINGEQDIQGIQAELLAALNRIK
ncbi:MAG: adenylate kinase [Anaerolineae bacterium]